jgi:hypothetical protein
VVREPGVPIVQEDGNWAQRLDYLKALAIYRRIVATSKGRSKWRDQAEAGVQRILSVDLSIAVGQAFLPGSEVLPASWRNVKKIELAHLVDSRARSRSTARSAGGLAAEWLGSIDLSRAEARELDARHAGRGRAPSWRSRARRAEARSGAYVLEARSGNSRARDLVLVSSTSLVLKCSEDRALLWATDARTSEPVGGADVAFWEHVHDGNSWTWRLSRLVTGEDGTALVKLDGRRNNEDIFAAATKGDRAAFVLGGYAWNRASEVPWKIYAFTDRSTYRPGGRVEWKVIARTRKDGAYATPADAKLEYDVVDPKGATVGRVLALNALAGLGRASTRTPPRSASTANFRAAELRRRDVFRVEEYKPFEFEVTSDGEGRRAGRSSRPRRPRPGTVEAATYYGAPVANADVEVLVKQRPLVRPWIPERHYPCCTRRNCPRGNRTARAGS